MGHGNKIAIFFSVFTQTYARVIVENLSESLVSNDDCCKLHIGLMFQRIALFVYLTHRMLWFLPSLVVFNYLGL